MAKFEAGEKCIFAGAPPGWENEMHLTHLRPGDIVHVKRHVPHARDKGGEFYELEEDWKNFFSEDCLRKLPPKHQPDDLKVAEPQFINHQLPRWLGLPEKEKALETE